MKKRVKEDLSLIRDEKTNAILNTNFLEYQNYLNLKKSKQNNVKKIEKLEKDVIEIKDTINEIKVMLLNISNNTKT